MKYIDADKLKAEIERQQRRLILLSHTEQVDMRRDCALQNGVYDNILSIIASLQQEQPEVDLEKAAEEYADKHGFRVPYDGSNNFYDDVDVKASLEGFKAGAKWMAEQMKGGGIPKNIEL